MANTGSLPIPDYFAINKITLWIITTLDLDATPFRAFLLVAKHRSFTRAAQEMNISQPALSATIRELERRLGFPLFTRTSRRVDLTGEGRIYLVNAKRIMIEHEWASQRAKDILRNDLRIAVQSYSALIPERVQLTDEFAAANPLIDLSVVQVSGNHIYKAIFDDEVDIALVLEPSHWLELSPLSQSDGAALETLTLARRPLGLFLPPGHPLTEREQIHTAGLKGLRVARPSRVHGGSIASMSNRYLDEMGAEHVRTPEGDAFSIIRYALRHGIAALNIGWFDSLLTDSGMASGFRAICGTPPETVLLAIRRRRDQRPSSECFWSYAAKGDWIRPRDQIAPKSNSISR